MPPPRVARAELERIWRAGVEAVQPGVLTRTFSCVEGGRFIWRRGQAEFAVALPEPGGRIFIAGAGKAVVPFAAALADVLGPHLHSGLIVTKSDHACGGVDGRIRTIEAAHPVPDERSVAAAEAMMRFCAQCSSKDLVFFLLTGGASALLAAPAAGISLADKQAVTRTLLRRGANIHEINTVRRHLSKLKGGGVLRHLNGARIITLAVSDVSDDAPQSIGSGLTVPDPTTFADVQAIFSRLGLDRDAPLSVLQHLARGLAGDVEETLKPGDVRLLPPAFHIIARLEDALAAAASAAASSGVTVERCGAMLYGPVEGCAELLVKEIDRLQGCARRPWVLIAGGEPDVTVTGSGLGGRNQHLALLLAEPLATRPGVAALVAGTDGTDGPTDAAGAFVDAQTLTRGGALGMRVADHVGRADSYTFFSNTGDLLITGPTGTNVSDLIIVSGGPHPAQDDRLKQVRTQSPAD
jgi:glycerate-2-kinase